MHRAQESNLPCVEYKRVTWHWVAKRYPSLLAYCRPVFIGKHLQESGFTDIKIELVSQNTVPSQIVTANKP